VLLFLQRTHELGTGLLNSVVALFSFAIILWGLSATTPLPILRASTCRFRLSGVHGARLCGHRHARRAPDRLAAHSDPVQPAALRVRFPLRIARVTDNAEPVALMGGEAVEREELRTRFWRLVRNWTALVQRQTRLIGFTAGYGHNLDRVSDPSWSARPISPARSRLAR